MNFVKDYAQDPTLRDSLNQLSKTIFGIKVLKQDSVNYVPFSFEKDGHIIANISVGTCHQIIAGQQQVAHIIQTVQTLPEYRNKGLIRHLFTHAHDYIEQHSGKSFLLAKRELANFYRQFGYTPVQIVDHFDIQMPFVNVVQKTAYKVNLNNTEAKANMAQSIHSRAPLSQIYGDVALDWLVFWYCEHIFSDDIYYVKALDVYVICQLQDDVLHIFDIIGKEIPSLAELVPYLCASAVRHIQCYFSPDKVSSSYTAVQDEETYFFFRGKLAIPQTNFAVPMTARG